MKLLLLVGLFPFMALTSCSDDDDDNSVVYENCPFVGKWEIVAIEDTAGIVSDYPDENNIVTFYPNGHYAYTPYVTGESFYESSESILERITYSYDEQELFIYWGSYKTTYNYSFSGDNNTLRLKLMMIIRDYNGLWDYWRKDRGKTTIYKRIE